MELSQPSEQLEFFNSITQLTWRDAIPLYHELEGRYKPGKSIKSEYRCIERHLGGLFLHKTTDLDITDYRVAREQEGVKASTINREHTRITRILNAFKAWRRRGSYKGYDFSGAELPEDNPGELVSKGQEFPRDRVVTPEEFAKWCDYAHPRVRRIAIVAILTLLRRKDISLLRDEHFDKTLNQLLGQQGKTKKPFKIPVAQTVRLMFMNKATEFICDFTNYRRLWTRACRDSGVNFRLMDLRRSGAVILLLEGENIVTIQKLLGHQDIKTTMWYLQPPEKISQKAVVTLEQKYLHPVSNLLHEFTAN